MRPYQYKPLGENQIRLVSLHPASSGAPLSICIQHASHIIAEDSYEALSYVWGDSESMCSLYCRESTNILITANLYFALLRLRLPDTPRLIWVDAICIDQSNLLERNSQVSLMNCIYKAAKRTVVYLGEEADDSGSAAVFLNTLFLQYASAFNIEKLTQQILSGNEKPGVVNIHQVVARDVHSNRQNLFGDIPLDVAQRALAHLLARPWFQRAWVIQEFILAKEIQMLVGTDEIEWDSFCLAFAYALPAAQVSWLDFSRFLKRYDFYRGMSQMFQMHTLRQEFHHEEGEGRRRLLVLLSSCRRARATKGVDKIFSLLGLCSDVLDSFPDYRHSDVMTFTMFAIMCIERGGTDAQDLFYEACVSDEREDRIPSWVPDWRSLPRRRNLGHSMMVMREDVTWFHAGRATKHSPRTSFLKVDVIRLIAKGIMLHTVVHVGHAANFSDGSSLNLEHLLNVLQSLQAFKFLAGSYPTGEPIDEVLAKILEVEQPRTEDNVTSFRESQVAQDILLEMDINNYQDQTLHSYPLTIAEINRLYREKPHGLRNAARAIAGRVFGITDQGYAGLLPCNAQCGDRICVLQGFAVPFVLRKGRKGCWTLVGDAYINGMMEGEMVDDTSSWEEIRIW